MNARGYSVYDQLTSMSGAAALGHDPLQRLASVTTASATTEFVYDGAMITEELNGSGAVLRRYVPGPDGTPLVWYEGSGETDRRWMLKDHQGSVAAVANTTQSSGLIALNPYDAYGVGGRLQRGAVPVCRLSVDPGDRALRDPGQELLPHDRAVPLHRPHRIWRRAELVRLYPLRSHQRRGSNGAGE